MKKFKNIPHLFSKIVVVWCVLVGTGASAWALRILSRTGHDATGLLSVILAFFGGELMVLCLKTILKNKKENNDNEREDYQAPCVPDVGQEYCDAHPDGGVYGAGPER
jgi:hypothetical protein